jgi:hypothetical protein
MELDAHTVRLLNDDIVNYALNKIGKLNLTKNLINELKLK